MTGRPRAAVALNAGSWVRRRRLRVPDPQGIPLAARGVRVRRAGSVLLDGVDLDVTPGEVVAVIGPNGAGKSTLLAAMAGDVTLDGGEVRLAGLPSGAWSAAETAMRRAVLPQRATMSFPFTVEEIVRMGRAIWQRTPRRAEDAAAVAEAMADADVTHLRARSFLSLSGGEQARVALARVLAQRTGVLLLDEPTAALDVHHQATVLAVARRRAVAGTAVAVVLHDLHLACAHADRVAILADGRVVAHGAAHEVMTSSLLSEVYGHPIDVLAHPRTGEPLVLPRQ